MSEREYWISFWKITVVCFLTLVISGVTSCQMTNKRITEMVEAGADPIESACAVSSERTQMCLIIVSKRD